eukprot:366458-Chlamydomonas_euryale.AAC.19
MAIGRSQLPRHGTATEAHTCRRGCPRAQCSTFRPWLERCGTIPGSGSFFGPGRWACLQRRGRWQHQRAMPALSNSARLVATTALSNSARVVAKPALSNSDCVVPTPALGASARLVATPALGASARLVATSALSISARLVATPALSNSARHAHSSSAGARQSRHAPTPAPTNSRALSSLPLLLFRGGADTLRCLCCRSHHPHAHTLWPWLPARTLHHHCRPHAHTRTRQPPHIKQSPHIQQPLHTHCHGRCMQTFRHRLVCTHSAAVPSAQSQWPPCLHTR